MSNAYSGQTRAKGAHGNVPNRMSMVPNIEVPRSKFDRSNQYKTTMNSGMLIPYFVDEVLPGDTFDLNSTLFARLATPIVPVMDNLYLETFFFFVPNRLVWNNWERFMGAQDNPGASTDFLIPSIDTLGGPIVPGSMGDYFGLPTLIPVPVTGPNAVHISALPFRAYNLIWNEWFRDQNLQNPAQVNKTDSSESIALYPLRRRGKRHDYFTSCLPWPQKGPGVELPLGSTAPIVFDGHPTSSPAFYNAGTGADAPIGALSTRTTTGGSTLAQGTTDLTIDVSKSHHVDLSSATAATINSLRQAFQIQRMLEKDARGGTRYIEVLRSHFGVISPDYRLQRPEYLGGSSTPINIHPVAQTGSTDATTPQANLAAIGIGASNKNGFSKSFTEHGIIIGLVNVRADLTYQQGLPRMWSRQTKYDFYWPSLAHLGEQAVMQKELYFTGEKLHDDAVFGYQERWAEYRYAPSRITGVLRSNHPATLDVWHLAQHFTSSPSLNASFIEDNPPINRIIATPEEPQFILDCYNRLHCSRVMPTYSVPGLIDHF